MPNVLIRLASTVEKDGFGQNGIIISSKDDHKYVLTARHLFDSWCSSNDKDIKITISDVQNSEFIVPISEVICDQEVDLALVKFESKKNYKMVKINRANNLVRGAIVYLDAISLCSYKKSSSSIRKIIHSKGNVINLLTEPSENTPKDAFDDGYMLEYTNNAASGMSGSPVFDTSGNLLAIHGLGISDGPCKTGSPSSGIPMSLFLQSNIYEKSEINGKINIVDETPLSGTFSPAKPSSAPTPIFTPVY